MIGLNQTTKFVCQKSGTKTSRAETLKENPILQFFQMNFQNLDLNLDCNCITFGRKKTRDIAIFAQRCITQSRTLRRYEYIATDQQYIQGRHANGINTSVNNRSGWVWVKWQDNIEIVSAKQRMGSTTFTRESPKRSDSRVRRYIIGRATTAVAIVEIAQRIPHRVITFPKNGFIKFENI